MQKQPYILCDNFLNVMLLYQCFIIYFFPHAAKPRARASPPSGGPLLFDDTSSGPPPMNNQNYYSSGYNMADVSAGGQEPGVDSLFADPVASAAMVYGSSLANQGKDIVNKEVRCHVLQWRGQNWPICRCQSCIASGFW